MTTFYRLSMVTMFSSAAVWLQFYMKVFNLMVTVYQKRSALLATAGLLINLWRRWLLVSPLFCFGCIAVTWTLYNSLLLPHKPWYRLRVWQTDRQTPRPWLRRAKHSLTARRNSTFNRINTHDPVEIKFAWYGWLRRRDNPRFPVQNFRQIRVRGGELL